MFSSTSGSALKQPWLQAPDYSNLQPTHVRVMLCSRWAQPYWTLSGSGRHMLIQKTIFCSLSQSVSHFQPSLAFGEHLNPKLNRNICSNCGLIVQHYILYHLSYMSSLKDKNKGCGKSQCRHSKSSFSIYSYPPPPNSVSRKRKYMISVLLGYSLISKARHVGSRIAPLEQCI